MNLAHIAPRRLAVLLAALGVFFGLVTAAHAQPGKVAMFNNPDYVDNGNACCGSEGPNTLASLQSFGETVTPFTDFSASGLTAALAGKDSLVIPEEEEENCLADDISDDAKTVIRNFVSDGGQLVVHAFGEDDCNAPLVNDIFDFSIVTSEEDLPTRGGSNPWLKTTDAVGTEFADGPDSLPSNNATGVYDETSLPDGARSIYSNGQGSGVVADIPFGDGSITTLGWDWYDSNPPDDGSIETLSTTRDAQGRGKLGGQDGGWQDVFKRSVDLPLLNVSDVSVTEGNSGTTPATFAVSSSQNHSEVIHAAYGTADGSALSSSDYGATSGTVSIDRFTLSSAVAVPVNGDTTIEPNETFTVGISNPAVAAVIGDGSGVGTIVNDDVAAPAVAKPKVGVAGVRRACVSSKTVRVRFTINAAAGIKSVTVKLDGKRVAHTTKSRFTVKVNVKKLKAGRHRLTAVALDNKGQKTTVRRTIARCAAAKPKHRAQPRFTG